MTESHRWQQSVCETLNRSETSQVLIIKSKTTVRPSVANGVNMPFSFQNGSVNMTFSFKKSMHEVIGVNLGWFCLIPLKNVQLKDDLLLLPFSRPTFIPHFHLSLYICVLNCLFKKNHIFDFAIILYDHPWLLFMYYIKLGLFFLKTNFNLLIRNKYVV